ncbi:MAG: Mur ligase domain-containing protein [Caldisericia bacterium]|nr:Mur ligase domain-containing protein [Caldisericia bacterium]MDD4613942.1 Mur ligase domain-containing protein [Caldisericia bacterium]
MPDQKHVYMTGIGGVGMTPLALYYRAMGYHVEGSDLQSFRMESILQNQGISIHYKQSKENIHPGITSLIYSAAIPSTNPELVEARACNIPCVHRIDVLKEIVQPKTLLSVTGSYGKSTTSTFLSSMAEQCGLQPSWLIGADMLHYPCARFTNSNYFVLETDESQPSFLDFHPSYLILTNIGVDHLTNYENNPEKLKQAMVHIVDNTKKKIVTPYAVKESLENQAVQNSWITCGFENGDYRITHHHTYFDGSGLRTSFHVDGKYSSFHAEIPMPSIRNVMDALLSFALVEDIVGPIATPSDYFSSLPVVERRFQFIPTESRALFIDDEGDSPDVIKQVLEDAKLYFPHRHLIVFLQPHRYSRLHNLFTEYVQAMQWADEVFILPVYAAGEEQENRKNSMDLFEALKKCHTGSVHYVHSLAEGSLLLSSLLRPSNAIITLGPGDVWKLYQDICE